MSDIDFEMGEPIWMVTVFHNTPGTFGVWQRALNAETETEAIAKTKELFELDGLRPIRIYRIEIEELKLIREEGENG